MHFALNQPNVGDGLELLRSLPNDSAACIFADFQYRAVLDKLAYGNEGARQSKRVALPQMSETIIHDFLKDIERALQPSRYLFQWCDKTGICQGAYNTTGLPIVDMITWNKQRFGMGYRTRRVGEYLLVRQKPPILAKATWTDHGIPDVWPESATGHPHAKPSHSARFLGPSRERPSCRRTAENTEKFAPFHIGPQALETAS